MVDSQAEKQHQRFMFYPVITSVLEIEKARQGANYVLAISAAPDVLDQLTGFRAKSTGVYLLREKQWAPAGSSRSKPFEKFAATTYQIKFEKRRKR